MSKCSEAGSKKVQGVTYCNFCGSISVRDINRFLQTAGTRFSGSDWRHGEPHRFYINFLKYYKFYSSHLYEASYDELRLFDSLSRKTFGISWSRDEKGIAFHCPKSDSPGGWQTSRQIWTRGTVFFDDYCGVTSKQLEEFFKKFPK